MSKIQARVTKGDENKILTWNLQGKLSSQNKK